jgi:FtsH-binding integral membrane protein
MRTKKIPVYNFISTGLAAALLLNVLIPHLLVAIYTFHYTPGLFTAILMNLPLSLVVLIKNRPNYKSTIQFSRAIFIFLIFGYLLFAITMRLAKILL